MRLGSDDTSESTLFDVKNPASENYCACEQLSILKFLLFFFFFKHQIIICGIHLSTACKSETEK